jgi:hypothetical protein
MLFAGEGGSSIVGKTFTRRSCYRLAEIKKFKCRNAKPNNSIPVNQFFKFLKEIVALVNLMYQQAIIKLLWFGNTQ